MFLYLYVKLFSFQNDWIKNYGKIKYGTLEAYEVVDGHDGESVCNFKNGDINQVAFKSVKDLIPYEKVYWPFRIWIPAIMVLVFLILDILRGFTKHDFLTRTFGPPISLDQFLKGPRLQEQTIDLLGYDQENVQDKQDNFPMSEIDGKSENVEGQNFCKHLENSA